MFTKIFIFKIHKRNIKVQYGDVEDGTDIFLDEAAPIKKKKTTKPGMREYIKKGKKRFAKFKRYRKKLDVLLDYTIRPVLKYSIYPLFNYIINPFFKVVIKPIYNFFKSVRKKLLDFIFSHWIFLFFKFKILRIYTFFRMQFLEFFNYVVLIFSILNSFAIKYIPFWISICAFINFICETIGKLILGLYHLVFLIIQIVVHFFKHIFYWRFILGENCSQMSTKLWLMYFSLKKAVMYWIILNPSLYRILVIIFASYFLSRIGFFSKKIRDVHYLKNIRLSLLFFSPIIFFSRFIRLSFDLQVFVSNLLRYLFGWFFHEIFRLVFVPVLVCVFIWIFLFDFDVFGKIPRANIKTEDKTIEDKLINKLLFFLFFMFRLVHVPASIYSKYVFNIPNLWEFLIFYSHFCFQLLVGLIFCSWLLEIIEIFGCFIYQFSIISIWPYFIFSEQIVPFTIKNTGVDSFNRLYESEDPEFDLGREFTTEELSLMSRFYYRNEVVYPKHIQFAGIVCDVSYFKNNFLSKFEKLKRSSKRTYKLIHADASTRLYDYETKLILEYRDRIMNEINFRKKQLILNHKDLLSEAEFKLLGQLEYKLKEVSELPNSRILISDVVRQLLNRRTLIIKFNEILLEEFEEILKNIKAKESRGLYEIKVLIRGWEKKMHQLEFEIFNSTTVDVTSSNIIDLDAKFFRGLNMELKEWMEERRKRIFQTNLYKKDNE